MQWNWIGVLDAASVALGIVYVLLIKQRNRWGWVAGACSSAVVVAGMFRAANYLQALLNAYYIAIAIYGWFSWTRNAALESGRIKRYAWRVHAGALLLIAVLSVLCAELLARYTDSTWPRLDALITFGSLYASVLVARSVLEHWIYWWVLDSLSVYLFLQQQLHAYALLYAVYLVIAILGYREWARRWRAQTTCA